MVTKFAPNGFSETLDRTTWAYATAPEFKALVSEISFTLDEVFDDIFFGIEGVKVKTRTPEKMVIIEQVIMKLNEAKAALQANQAKSGRQALFEAKDLFRSLRK